MLVDDPSNLEKIRRKEMDVLKERLNMIIGQGATVILTTKGIDDLASKYMVEAKVLGTFLIYIYLYRFTKSEQRGYEKSR